MAPRNIRNTQKDLNPGNRLFVSFVYFVVPGIIRRLVFVFAVGASVCGFAAQPESHAVVILAEIKATQSALQKEFPQARFLAFWDFDGTLLKGDCSEGLIENGKVIYPDLMQLGIERGLASHYPASGGFAAFWQDYQTMDERVGHWLAYPFLPQIFAGTPADALAQLAEEHFASTLNRYYFASSKYIFDGLAAAGVENHVITASGEILVRGASASLGLPANRIHGIRVRVVNGILTSELIYPVTFAEGKRTRLLEILHETEAEIPNRPVFILAAFGNSYSTDSDFLAYTAKQSLPAGRAVAVMVNGGEEPERYRGLFRRVDQNIVVGEP